MTQPQSIITWHKPSERMPENNTGKMCQGFYLNDNSLLWAIFEPPTPERPDIWYDILHDYPGGEPSKIKSTDIEWWAELPEAPGGDTE